MSRRSKVEWSVILKELATSGQSRAQFAATRGIPLATLVYQLSRQRRRAASEVSRTPAFVEVGRAAASSVSSAQIEIQIGDVICVRASSWPSPSWLLALVAEQRGGRC